MNKLLYVGIGIIFIIMMILYPANILFFTGIIVATLLLVATLGMVHDIYDIDTPQSYVLHLIILVIFVFLLLLIRHMWFVPPTVHSNILFFTGIIVATLLLVATLGMVHDIYDIDTPQSYVLHLIILVIFVFLLFLIRHMWFVPPTVH